MKGILPFTITILVLLTCGGSRATADNPPLPDTLPGLRIAGPEIQGCYDSGDLVCGQSPGACGASQWFFYCDLEFCSGTLCRRVRAENFPPPGVTLDPNDPNDWIGVITWYGVYVNDWSEDCVKTNGHQFRIRFYPDADEPDPNGHTYEEFLIATPFETGQAAYFGNNAVPIWYWTATLASPVAMAAGWFSITGLGTPLCYHLWQGSNEGDDKYANWFESDIPASYQIRTTFCDIGYCFWRAASGACCIDQTGACQEDVLQITCDALGGRFLLNQPCAALDPPCGEGVGACCFDDGTCELLTYPACVAAGDCDGDADCDGDVDFEDIDPFVAALAGAFPCRFGNVDANNDGVLDFDDIDAFIAALGQPCPARTQGPVWLGAGSACGQCCTIPPGLPTEGEPRCQDDHVDAFNGGCDSTPPVFSTIPFDTWVFGESGTFLRGGAPARDSDWYPFSILAPSYITAQVEAEFPVEVLIAHAGGCDPNAPGGYWTAGAGAADACIPLAVDTPPVSGGTYWLVIRPQAELEVPCGADYKVYLHAESGAPCEIVCQPDYTELEPCGEDINWGCDPNGPPHHFEPLPPFVSGDTITICGTLFTSNGIRNSDWYSFTLPVQGTLTWEFEAELPILTSPIFGSGNFDPPICGWPLWNYLGPTNTPCIPPGNIVHVAPTDLFRANVTYWWFVMVDDEAIFHGYPCSEGQNEYRLTITYTQVECSDVCTGATYQEGEPDCGPGYADTFNGGCDAATFAIQPAITYISSYCGRSGTWIENDVTKRDYDWWKIQLTGTVNKRLRINMRSEFNMVLELYRITDPNNPCTTRQRLDYYELSACEPTLNIYTRCLTPSVTAYYALRVVPTRAPTCSDENTYKFVVTVESETPACTTCTVTCSTSPDDACQDDPNDPATNEGCDVTPNVFMPFQVGNNTYGPQYCGHTSTYVDGSGGARVDLDWFEFDLPAGRTKLLIRGKAEFRMSIKLALDCTEPGVAHGWDRACKGTTSPFVNTWTGLTAATQYYGVIIYGNGGGDGTSENPLIQFFSGLPCSETFNEWQVELQAQP